MKILITGANGQLGKELQIQLGKNSKYEALYTDVDEMDICNIDDIRSVFDAFKPEIVINCAAFTAVDACEDEDKIEIVTKINTLGPQNIAIISCEFGAKMVHISTDYVFDGSGSKPYIENDETNPQSVYGQTKKDAEIAVARYNKKHFILRTAWLYGDGKNFVRTMLHLAKKNGQLKIVDDQYGSPTSTRVLAESIIVLMNTEKYGIYHATCEGICTWYEFAKEIFEYSNIDIIVNPCSSEQFPQKAKRLSYSVLDNKNLTMFFHIGKRNWIYIYNINLDKDNLLK